MKLRDIIVALSIAAMSANVMGAGFEKVVQWSAKWSSIGGAATGAVTGADALYFNPAGLGRMKADNQLSGNLTQTRSSFKGPIVNDNVELNSISKTSLLPGFLYARKITPDLTIGIGAYTAGGTGANFGSVSFDNNVGLRPEVSTEISILEYALGASYYFTPKISFGAALRLAQARGYFTGGNTVTNIDGAAQVKYTGLEDNATGFKAGWQYMDKDWGLGFSYRSEIDLKLKGDGEILADGAVSGGISGDSTLENAFPYQWALGGYYQVNRKLRTFAEVVFTEYSTNDRINVATTTKDSFGAAVAQTVANTVANTAIEQDWDDQWNYKVGAEYVNRSMSYRAGYALTSQVTPEKRARATFASPGKGHTLTTGVGKHWRGKHFLDAAIEYSWAEGKNGDSSFASPLGDYSTNALSIHTSYTVNF